MKITVKEFVKLDLQGLMKINGGTSACGNYKKPHQQHHFQVGMKQIMHHQIMEVVLLLEDVVL